MEKYKHPDDEARLRALFADFVTSGRSVMLGKDGHMPAPFSDYDIQEVGVCASDLITDEFLLVVGERDDAVYVISASHGYNPILVIPTKALVRLKQANVAKLKEEVSAFEKNTWMEIGKFVAAYAWQITCTVIAGLLVLKFQKQLGL
jgi:hypothetical protein